MHWYKCTDHSTFSCKISHILYSFLETRPWQCNFKVTPVKQWSLFPASCIWTGLDTCLRRQEVTGKMQCQLQPMEHFLQSCKSLTVGEQVALAYWKMRPRNRWQDTRRPNDKMRSSNICQSPANLVPWVRSKVKPSKTENICSPDKTSSHCHCTESYNK